jgi:hypothetical protein
VVWVDLNSFGVVGDRAGGIVLGRVHAATARVCIGEKWVDLDGFGEVGASATIVTLVAAVIRLGRERAATPAAYVGAEDASREFPER